MSHTFLIKGYFAGAKMNTHYFLNDIKKNYTKNDLCVQWQKRKTAADERSKESEKTGCRKVLAYSWRKASMGSRRAALKAGKIPKTMPTMTDTLKAKRSCSGFTMGAERFSFTKKVMNFVSSRDTPTPNTPPRMESRTASTMTCRRMSILRAPMAFLMPISLMR